MGIHLATPTSWWNKLNKEFCFTLDAAADDDHHMGDIQYLTLKDDALQVRWTGTIWCSPPWDPPYLSAWVKKGYESARHLANKVIMLLPVRPRSHWWHKYAMYASEIRFINGTLDFVPFDKSMKVFKVEPQCLVIFKAKHEPPAICRGYPNR